MVKVRKPAARASGHRISARTSGTRIRHCIQTQIRVIFANHMRNIQHMKKFGILGVFLLSMTFSFGQTPAETFLSQYDDRTQQVILETVAQAFVSWTIPSAAAGYLRPYESSFHLLADLNAGGTLTRQQVFTLAHYVMDTLTDDQLTQIATQVNAEEIFSQEYLNKYGSFAMLLHQIYTTGEVADSIQVVEGAYELGIVAGTLTFDRLTLLQTLKSQLSQAQMDYLSVPFDQAMAATPDTLGERLGNFYGMFTDERLERVQYFAAILMSFLQSHEPVTRTDLLPFWGWAYFMDYDTDGTLTPEVLGSTILEAFSPEQLTLLGLVVPQLMQMDAVLASPDQGLIMALSNLKETGVIDDTQYFEDITEWYLRLGLQARTLSPFFATALCGLSDEQVNAFSGLTSLDLLLAYKAACPVSSRHEISTYPLDLYPNPVRDLIRLPLDQKISGPVAIRIWNTQGQQVLQQQYPYLPASLDVRALPGGMLFIQIESGSDLYLGKVIKE